MALITADRVMETSTTTGTGAFTLAGAVTGYKAFSAVCSTSDTCYYCIEAVDDNGNPSGEWETGLGTYSGTNTLTRTTVIASSNSNNAVNFSAGTKRAFISEIARALAIRDEWTVNFTGDGDVYIAARVAMTIGQGNTAIGSATLAYAKSTAAAPSTFNSTTLPATLEAGAWLKVTASSVSGFVAQHLKRTA